MRRWTLPAVGVLALGLAFAAGQSGGEKKGEPAKAGPLAKAAPRPDTPPPPRAAKSRLVKVTVYPNSALVTREVEVPAGQGLAELVVAELPLRTVDSSLYSEGSDG